MLSASAYSFRLKSRLAISLSWVAGYTNVITFILCAAVTSHATGNLTHFGQQAAEGHWPEVAYFGFVVAAFFLGAVCSACLTEGARRRGVASKYILPVGLQALLLTAIAFTINYYGLDHRHAVNQLVERGLLYWLSGLASFAMGLQNATITRISGAVVRTTHVTGVVTDLGLEGVQYVLWAWDKTRLGGSGRAGRVLRISRRHPSVLRVALLASIVGSFLFGVVAGTVAFEYGPRYAMLVPVSFLLWIVVTDWRKPIADVRELDLLRDPELSSFGLAPGESLKSFLPPELGIYRLTHHRRDTHHHAPDFQLWVDRLPRHWRVVILAVSPLTHFDPDAVLDLQAAVQKLRASRRDLIVCGVNRPQFKVLMKMDFPEFLGFENFAPDLDFAIARGMNLVSELTDVREVVRP
jgi:uncharacterized membrane protein YoaK (UPF0700 family)